MANVRRLHRSEQSLSKGFLSFAEYRCPGGQRSRVQVVKFLGRLLRVQSN